MDARLYVSCPSNQVQELLTGQIRLSHLSDSRRTVESKGDAEMERRVRVYCEILMKTEAKIRDAVENATILEEGFAESWDENFFRHLGLAFS